MFEEEEENSLKMVKKEDKKNIICEMMPHYFPKLFYILANPTTWCKTPVLHPCQHLIISNLKLFATLL